MSSCWGQNIRVSIFGQSHSEAVGAVVDGLPVGFRVDREALSAFMARRAPGQSALTTTRAETDIPEIVSGLADGVTCGAPLCIIIRNANTRPADYAELKDTPRPGHADYTAEVKYHGFQDRSGGGHFSGRLTAPLCAAGGICLQMLAERKIFIGAHIQSIAGIQDKPFDPVGVSESDFENRTFTPLTVLDPEAGKAMEQAITEAKKAGDSVGGVIECAVVGLPAGLGDPMFGGMENRIASMVFGIPAVRGIEFGDGFASASLRGSQNNDPFIMDGGQIRTQTNHHGGILGGITSGMPFVFRAAFKPTPSIAIPQQTVNLSTHTEKELRIKGRHDPCIVPRAVPVVEAAAALAVVDALMGFGS